MVGGYSMIDCSGLVLTEEGTQTINGIYEQVDNAYKANKPCWAYNCGYNDGMLTPVPVMILNESATEYVATSSILQIRITNDDACEVVSLIA